MISEATKENLRRKSAYVDKVQMRDGVPMFSWVDLNLTELCNRQCVFCPRIDPAVYPNQALHMSMSMVESIRDDLVDIGFDGAIVICGFGEPMLHPRFDDIVQILAPKFRVELVTNGDRLSVGAIAKLASAGLAFFVVSLYDGPHQVDEFNDRFDAAGVDPSDYLLRDRWHSESDRFGLKLTNRAGTIDVGPQDPVDVTRPCHYLAYQLTVDWNGDVLLCVQDWNKRVRFGNAAGSTLWDIWTSPAMMKARARLIGGNRTHPPCVNCNTDGCLHGFNHVPAWEAAWAR